MIEVSGAQKQYGHTTALANVDLTAAPGQVTAVVGPNGAGKSTLFRCLLGLETLDGGFALIDGHPYARSRSPLQCAGAAIDASTFHPGRRAVDEVRIAATAGGLPSRRVTAVLDEVGLGAVAHKRVKSLSMGMRQRLGLAVALLGRPRNLILDEPLNGLDVDGIHWIRDLLRTAAAEGSTVLISSHVLSELELVSDHVCILSNGRVLQTRDLTGTSESNLARYVVAVSDTPDELASLLSTHGATSQREGNALLIRGMTLRAVAELTFRERFFVESLSEAQDSLENEYLRLLAEMEPRDPALRELPREKGQS
ncbi:ATP-binding cassette domain-containing protein [Paeniglutamicibacter sp. NPDC091659]|uniref:ATP-binding cassette domain-containing protein n=1 Tax=Paeniglutamicibacter sp. NPDC091659 TaxID=3364389 RepID=UPI00381C3528